jgi:hypothetical protein
MKVNVYTKIVLTGIFGCLLWLCVVLTPIGMPVQAPVGPTPVVLAGFQQGGQLLQFSGSHGLPVTVLTASSATTPQPFVGQPAPAAPSSSAVEDRRRPTPVPSQPAARQQCAATTKRGTRCSRLADVGSAYCWQHK